MLLKIQSKESSPGYTNLKLNYSEIIIYETDGDYEADLLKLEQILENQGQYSVFVLAEGEDMLLALALCAKFSDKTISGHVVDPCMPSKGDKFIDKFRPFKQEEDPLSFIFIYTTSLQEKTWLYTSFWDIGMFFTKTDSTQSVWSLLKKNISVIYV